MKKDSPIVYLFYDNNTYYMYDMHKHKILTMPFTLYKEIKKLVEIGYDEYFTLHETSSIKNDILHLISKGFLKKSQINEIANPNTDNIYSLVNRCLINFTLQITQDCNFKCRYCQYASGKNFNRLHSKKVMSWDVAKASIDYLYNHNKEVNKVDIGFYGGEPFLEFNLIKKCVEYAKSKFQLKNLVFSTTTNLSLFTPEIIDFVVSNNFELLISLDGPKTIHDLQRKFLNNGKGTFDIVEKNLKFLRDRHKNYFDNRVKFNPVIMDIKNIDNIYQYFNKTLSIADDKVNPSFVDWEDIDYYLTDNYNNNDDITINNKNNYMIKRNNSSLEMFSKIVNQNGEIGTAFHHGGPCITGCSKIFVDINGNFIPCEKVSEKLKIETGNVFKGCNIQGISDIINIGKITENECKSCWAIRYCKICITSCIDENGNISKESKLEKCIEERNTIKFHMLNYISLKGEK